MIADVLYGAALLVAGLTVAAVLGKQCWRSLHGEDPFGGALSADWRPPR